MVPFVLVQGRLIVVTGSYVNCFCLRLFLVRVRSICAGPALGPALCGNCLYYHFIFMMPSIFFQFAVLLWTFPAIGTWILLGDHYIH